MDIDDVNLLSFIARCVKQLLKTLVTVRGFVVSIDATEQIRGCLLEYEPEPVVCTISSLTIPHLTQRLPSQILLPSALEFSDDEPHRRLETSMTGDEKLPSSELEVLPDLTQTQGFPITTTVVHLLPF